MCVVWLCVLLRTAVNLPPPSSVLFGAQHKRMLEATQARIPQSAPTMPGVPPAKPIIEKMELPHARAQCSQSVELVCRVCVVCAVCDSHACATLAMCGVRCTRRSELPHTRVV